jgi:beta-N-acetylhexosaminidase
MFLDFLQEADIAGVILFKRNVESPDQVKELIQCLQEARGAPLLVSVDHEGGRVFRLPEPFTLIPPARIFGHYYDQTQDLDLISAIGTQVALQLRSVGFNLNYAPVLDVDSCAENPIIGDRSFHRDANRAGRVAMAFAEGLHQGGVLSCGKHFPGHGDTCEDSHLTLPEVLADAQTLSERELQTFKIAIEQNIPALMSAHVRYPVWDPENCATLSRIINQDILRQRLGFQGVLFSDDLFMKGIAQSPAQVPSQALGALKAGCDVLLLCHDEPCQRETYAILSQACQEDEALVTALSAAAPRVERLFERLTTLEAQALSAKRDLPALLTQLRGRRGDSSSDA